MGRSNRRESNKSSGKSFSGFRSNFGSASSSFSAREMHKAKCSECGKDCEVPFKPSQGKPVYCRDCFRTKKKW